MAASSLQLVETKLYGSDETGGCGDMPCLDFFQKLWAFLPFLIYKGADILILVL